MFLLHHTTPGVGQSGSLSSLWGRTGFDGVVVGTELRVEVVRHLVKQRANQVVANNNNFFAARAVA